MRLEEIRKIAQQQDTNTYLVNMDTINDDIELIFEMQVDMPYQYWIEMHQFYMWHEQSLKQCGGDVIRRVIKFYGQRIIEYLADGKPWSPRGVNQMLDEVEGLVGTKFITVNVIEFDFDYEIATNYEIKSKG
ncbi:MULTISPECIES: hypothetical protein [unclassified Psychrobacter]|uniref:hypothetical protein n=1 Tax=unclassified Psychrobacter TaxID=196806 RepID=UPI003FD43A1C